MIEIILVLNTHKNIYKPAKLVEVKKKVPDPTAMSLSLFVRTSISQVVSFFPARTIFPLDHKSSAVAPSRSRVWNSTVTTQALW